MKIEEDSKQTIEKVEEYPDNWWYRVYAGVIITAILTISALWTFSRYFSN